MIVLPTLDSIHAKLIELAARPALADGFPAFLFRGERSIYPTTLSTLDRHCRDLGLLSAAYTDLDDVAEYAMKHTIFGWDLCARMAAAFCQHYGLPTQMFDFTASANVAVSFAANRKRQAVKARTGRMGILDVKKARDGGCTLFDLRKFGQALRPKNQQGFGMMLAYFDEDDIPDLKDPDLSLSIGLEWLEFGHLPDDETYLFLVGAESDLLSLEGDEAARLPQELVDQFVKNKRALSHVASEILSKEIPPFGRTKEQNHEHWIGNNSKIG